MIGLGRLSTASEMLAEVTYRQSHRGDGSLLASTLSIRRGCQFLREFKHFQFFSFSLSQQTTAP